jgi:hypothetical protein
MPPGRIAAPKGCRHWQHRRKAELGFLPTVTHLNYHFLSDWESSQNNASEEEERYLKVSSLPALAQS